MSIKLYGSLMGSTARTRWMIEEVGVPYEFVPTNLREEAGREAFRAVFPGLKMPYLVDGDTKVFESVAINFYLAEKYAPALMPTDVVERAHVYQWSLWAITNLQPEGLTVLRHSMMLPPEKRDPQQLEAGRAGCRRYLDQIEGAFEGDYLVGNRFTVADVNCGWTVSMAARAGITVGAKTQAYVERLRARPAWQKAQAG